jgi:hypothetical protein
MTITVTKIESAKKLYRHYAGQSDAQPVQLFLNCKEELLGITFNGEIGNAHSFDEHYGHTQIWGVVLKTTSLMNELLDEITPLAQRAIDGYDSKWNGNNNVAAFSDDAQEALGEIEQLTNDFCDDGNENHFVQVMNAGDYFNEAISRHDENGNSCAYRDEVHSVKIDGYDFVITAKTTDDELSDIATMITNKEETDVLIVEGIDEYLKDERDNCE